MNNGLIATNANQVIYTKAHLAGGQKLDKQKDDSHISLTIV